ncbi:MAG: PHB depolymerase family esterase [Verrucomicrobiia bacterium]
MNLNCLALLLVEVVMAASVVVAADGEVVFGKLPGGLEGRYMLFVPPQAKAGLKLPLIVALHGAGGKPDGPIQWWKTIAAERGYFVLAPKSNGGTWPGGDQSHVARMVVALERERPIDPKRVLLTGVSDGGTWSYVLGFQDPKLFAALAPISGVMMRTIAGSLRMQPKMPICVVHGTDDKVFIVARARATVKALKNEHYNVNYIEVAGGRHGWFREQAAAILDWFEKLPSL